MMARAKGIYILMIKGKQFFLLSRYVFSKKNRKRVLRVSIRRVLVYIYQRCIMNGPRAWFMRYTDKGNLITQSKGKPVLFTLYIFVVIILSVLQICKNMKGFSTVKLQVHFKFSNSRTIYSNRCKIKKPYPRTNTQFGIDTLMTGISYQTVI